MRSLRSATLTSWQQHPESLPPRADEFTAGPSGGFTAAPRVSKETPEQRRRMRTSINLLLRLSLSTSMCLSVCLGWETLIMKEKVVVWTLHKTVVSKVWTFFSLLLQSVILRTSEPQASQLAGSIFKPQDAVHQWVVFCALQPRILTGEVTIFSDSCCGDDSHRGYVSLVCLMDTWSLNINEAIFYL